MTMEPNNKERPRKGPSPKLPDNWHGRLWNAMASTITGSGTATKFGGYGEAGISDSSRSEDRGSIIESSEETDLGHIEIGRIGIEQNSGDNPDPDSDSSGAFIGSRSSH